MSIVYGMQSVKYMDVSDYFIKDNHMGSIITENARQKCVKIC